MVSLTAARLPSFKGLGRGTTGWTRSFKLTTPVYVENTSSCKQWGG